MQAQAELDALLAGASAASLAPCTETISVTGSSSGSGANAQLVAIGPPAEWWAKVSAGLPRSASQSRGGVS